MSRTVAIKGVKIRSIPALRNAVKDLAEARNIKCELVDNAKPRLWGGETGKVCEHVLRMPGRFDIGFSRQGDGTYDMVCDLHGGELAKYVGNTQRVAGASGDQMQVGYLAQLYGKHAAMEIAMANGYPISGVSVLPDGSIAVDANVMQMQA